MERQAYLAEVEVTARFVVIEGGAIVAEPKGGGKFRMVPNQPLERMGAEIVADLQEMYDKLLADAEEDEPTNNPIRVPGDDQHERPGQDRPASLIAPSSGE